MSLLYLCCGIKLSHYLIKFPELLLNRLVAFAHGFLARCDGPHNLVVWGDRGVGDILVLERDCIGQPLLSCLLDVAIVYSIMLR